MDYLNDEHHTINFVSQNTSCFENDFMNEFIEILKINKIPYQSTCSKLKEGDDLIQFNLFHHWFAIGYSYYYGCHVMIDLENYVTCHNLEHATILIINDISMIEDWAQFITLLYTDMDFQSGSEIDLNRYFEYLEIYGEI